MTELNKYHNGKIYKITSPQSDKFYIGSTINDIRIRLSKHKNNYKNYLNGKYCYVSSFEVIKYDDCIIELLKEVKCESKTELEIEEGKTIKEYQDRILNKNVAGRTKKEYRELNKDISKEYQKNYRELNKDKLKAINKEYHELNKDKRKERAKQYYKKNKDMIIEQSKEYRELNKDEVKVKNKEYRELNKDKIKQRKQQKIECICGSIICKDEKSRHDKSKKHISFTI